jgi:para-nitrobenzyl esterase
MSKRIWVSMLNLPTLSLVLVLALTAVPIGDVFGASGGPSGAPAVIGAVWQWVQTLYNDDTKTAPAKPENYTVQFLDDGKLKVKADCNMKGGTYSTEGKKLSIKITHSTMAACEPGSLEDRFVRDLAAGTAFFLKDGYLYLDVKHDTGTMKFSNRNE